eukprot:SAG11_NODE_23787_length_383_cov_0.707746_1_plen_88_part_00
MILNLVLVLGPIMIRIVFVFLKIKDGYQYLQDKMHSVLLVESSYPFENLQYFFLYIPWYTSRFPKFITVLKYVGTEFSTAVSRYLQL